MNENLVYEFLDKEGVSSLSKAILSKVNSRIDERIVTTVDENSDAKHVPPAAAVYAAISKMGQLKFKTHTGPIEDVAEPNGSYIYLQRDDAADTTWVMYVYDEVEGWIDIGNTEVNLANYWSKDPADVEALKVALGLSIEGGKTVTEALDEKVDHSQMVKLTDVDISAAVDGAYGETDPKINAPSITVPVIPDMPVAAKLYAADANGMVPNFDPTGLPSVDFTLTKGADEYTNARMIVDADANTMAHVQAIAFDTNGNAFNILKSGWGAPSGFPVMNATTKVYIVADQAGTYTATVKLVDVNNSYAVITSADMSMTVTA